MLLEGVRLFYRKGGILAGYGKMTRCFLYNKDGRDRQWDFSYHIKA